MSIVTQQVYATTTPEADVRTACIAVVWLKGELESGSQVQVAESVEQFPGVESARVSPSRAHMLVVRFDHGRTRASEIISELSAAGYDAKLVGC
ncbi:MAG: hypothetical protein JSW10_05630 [Pseudomonadota bacterium]|nr:MAG: hypothetical protein JSW10_05630 [Pseudomonadota bacterium]